MAWYKRLVNLGRSRRLSRDLDREMAFHLAERADELVAAGMSEADAAYAARRRFGNPTLLKERTRDVDVLTWLESLAADVRYAVRALRASPGFASVAVLSLALGIGANTAIFGLIDAVMLKSLPVARPHELVQVTMGGNREEFTNPLWEELRRRQDVFAGAFAVASVEFNLAAGGEARRAAGSLVSGDFFTTLGLRPTAGRLLTPADDVRGCPGAAVLGEAFWRVRYGGDPGVVGKTISLDGHPYSIVGVAPAGFFGVDVGRQVQVYAPLCADDIRRGGESVLDNRSTWFLFVLGRPKGGTTPEQVRARLAAASPGIFGATIPTDWPAEHQREYLSTSLDVRPAPSGLSGLRAQYRGALLALMAAVAVVLLVACANVANLLLARATARQREMAVRVALGASRGRVVRQLLTESVLLSLVGAAAGVLLARWGSELLVRMLSTRTDAVWLELATDWRVLAFTIAVATATGIVFGLAPALRAARVSPQAAMQATGRGVAEGHSRFTTVKALVVGQVALSLVLVVAAGLLLGTFRALATLDPGFSGEGVLLVTADLRNARYPDDRLREARAELLERMRGIPGVRAASASEITPISGMGWTGPATVEGYTPAKFEDALVFYNEVSDRYFETMRTTVIAGREFDRRDRLGAPRVAVVNGAVARRFFGGVTPLGKQVRVDVGPKNQYAVEVVGLVEDAKYRSLREDPRPTVYLPMAQSDHPGPMVNFELRTDGAPAALARHVTAAAAHVHPAIALDLRPMTDQMAASLTRERLLATLSGFFGALALLLAVVGLYGTTAYSVARRRNEIGIRIALGAARGRVVRMVLGEVGRLVAVGVVLGALAALAATRAVSSFLYGVTPTDPTTLGLSALALVAAAVGAGALPAWRASRIDPVVALREE